MKLSEKNFYYFLDSRTKINFLSNLKEKIQTEVTRGSTKKLITQSNSFHLFTQY